MIVLKWVEGYLRRLGLGLVGLSLSTVGAFGRWEAIDYTRLKQFTCRELRGGLFNFTYFLLCSE